MIPFIREIEWLFGTKLGREELTSQAKYNRLAVVHLNRAHTYESLDAIIAELSPKVMELAPKGIPASYKVKFFSKISYVFSWLLNYDLRFHYCQWAQKLMLET